MLSHQLTRAGNGAIRSRGSEERQAFGAWPDRVGGVVVTAYGPAEGPGAMRLGSHETSDPPELYNT